MKRSHVAYTVHGHGMCVEIDDALLAHSSDGESVVLVESTQGETCILRNSWGAYYRKRFAPAGGINDEDAAPVSGQQRHMPIEACERERPGAAVAIGGLEIASRLRLRHVPGATPQVRYQWQCSL